MHITCTNGTEYSVQAKQYISGAAGQFLSVWRELIDMRHRQRQRHAAVQRFRASIRDHEWLMEREETEAWRWPLALTAGPGLGSSQPAAAAMDSLKGHTHIGLTLFWPRTTLVQTPTRPIPRYNVLHSRFVETYIWTKHMIFTFPNLQVIAKSSLFAKYSAAEKLPYDLLTMIKWITSKWRFHPSERQRWRIRGLQASLRFW
jgi:hypothetical protein